MAKSTSFNRTELGNAELFASLYAGKVKYDHLRGKWFIWTGVRWREDKKRDVDLLARATLRERRRRAEKVTTKEIRDKEIMWTLQAESESRLSSMLRLAQAIPEMKTSGYFWDSDPFLLGTEDAVVNLRTGKAVKATPKLMITSSVATKFDPAAQCDLWKQTIESFWPNRPDMARFIQKAVGYSFTGNTREQVIFSLFGAGSNGKSVFQNTLVRLAGDYGYVAPFSTLEFHERGGISNDVAILQGKRLVIASETQENIRLNEGRIKSLTGDSHITARFLYQEPFTFTPVAKFWLGFNHKPKVVDDSHGFWRRIRLITFDRIFTEKEQDKDLEAKLQGEFPGILNWIIEGCQMWLKEGLQPSDKILHDTEMYKQESNPLTDFIDDCCIRSDSAVVSNTDIWEEYCVWARRTGERFPLGRKGFSQRLEGMGFVAAKRGYPPLRVWKGLKIGKMQIEVEDDPIAVN